MVRIRLGRDFLVDQCAILADVVLIGFGLVVGGAVADRAGWITVPMIVIGVLFLLVGLLRLHGWRSLVRVRELTVGPDGIACTGLNNRAFRVRWDQLAAAGCRVDPDADPRYALRLIFCPAARDGLTVPGALPLVRHGALQLRMARHDALGPALDVHAPADWRRLGSGADALVVAPAVAPELVPHPGPAEPAVYSVGSGLARQGITGAVLGGFFGVCGLLGAASAGAPTGMRIAFGIVGALFLVVPLLVLLSIPVMSRRRRLVLDPSGVVWDDGGSGSFALPWRDITAVTTAADVVKGVGGGREFDRVLLHTADGVRDLPLGDQPRVAADIVAGVQRFAPELWQGANVRQGRLGLG